MAEPRFVVAEQFETPEQQHETATLGLWTFLVTEIMFFAGLFLAYIVYRHAYHPSFEIASRHTNLIYGTLNTAVLLTSSLTMALAIRAAQTGRSRASVRLLLITILFAAAFMGIKGVEYYEHFRSHEVPGSAFRPLPGAPKAELFFYLYFAMTGLHALHVTVGIGLLSVMAFLASRQRFDEHYYTPLELSGLYWHFVDLVWIFLYPLIYLIDRHQ
jgi:cytochrome c oxidase subunit 3